VKKSRNHFKTTSEQSQETHRTFESTQHLKSEFMSRHSEFKNLVKKGSKKVARSSSKSSCLNSTGLKRKLKKRVTKNQTTSRKTISANNSHLRMKSRRGGSIQPRLSVGKNCTSEVYFLI